MNQNGTMNHISEQNPIQINENNTMNPMDTALDIFSARNVEGSNAMHTANHLNSMNLVNTMEPVNTVNHVGQANQAAPMSIPNESDSNTVNLQGTQDSAQQEDSKKLSHTSLYPPVPPYYLHFNEDENNPFMVPPPPMHEIIPNQPYPLFGALIASQDQERTAIRPRDHNTRELFIEGNLNKKKTIRSLVKSLLLNYMELLQILEVNPMQMVPDIPEAHFFTTEEPTERSPIQWKMQQIHLILANINYLLNLYRPIQAKLELKRLLLQQQKEWIEHIKVIDDFMKAHTQEFADKFKQIIAKHPSDEVIDTQMSDVEDDDTTKEVKKRKREDDSYDFEPTIPFYTIPEHIINEFFS